jgi:predicted GIY-YIG superfamily endonuclease
VNGNHYVQGDAMKWSKWFRPNQDDPRKIPNAVVAFTPEKPGVYELRYAPRGRPARLRRLVGVDAEALFYIGSSKNLRRRLAQFYRGYSHSAAGTYKRFYRSRFALEDLEFRWGISRSKTSAVSSERRMLLRYMNRFLDRPPLNLELMRGF